jgi:hypothetical protein
MVSQFLLRRKDKVDQLLALYLIFFVVYLVKIRHSMFFIPADPGIDYLIDANRGWLENLTILADGQLVVGYKIIANSISVLSPRSHALAMGIVIAGLWALGATFIARFYSKITNHLMWSMTIGLLVILAPAASESQLGNIGGTRWLLYLVVALMISNTDQYFKILMSNRRLFGLAILILLLGLTNPISFALIPGLAVTYFWQWRSLSARMSKFNLMVIGLILLTIAIQLFSVLQTDREIGRKSTATYFLWSGAGFYWKFIVFAPIAVVGVVLFLLQRNHRHIAHSRTILLLCIQSASIYIATYVLAGISDRYLIAPYVLSFVALVVLVSEIGVRKRKFDSMIMVTSLAVALLASILWFSASTYLTSGLSWSNQIDNVVEQCSTDREASVQLVFSDGNPNDVPCDYILGN